MKKRNEGYALPFVLVVMVVLCLVSVSILSFSLRNLQTQQASIERMQAQYAAEGRIEMVVSQLKSVSSFDGLSDACSNANVSTSEPKISPDEKTVTLELSTVVETIKITCSLKLTGETDLFTTVEGNTLYSFGNAVITYTSYAISTVEPAPEEDGGDPH